MALSLFIMDRKRFTLCMVVSAVLLALVIVPGILAVNILAHEMYHMFSLQTVARSVCVDVNSKPYVAHVDLVFPNSTDMRAYLERQQDGQEDRASFVGNMASVLYVVFSLFVIFILSWVLTVSVNPKKIHRRIVSHMKRLRRRKK